MENTFKNGYNVLLNILLSIYLKNKDCYSYNNPPTCQSAVACQTNTEVSLQLSCLLGLMPTMDKCDVSTYS